MKKLQNKIEKAYEELYDLKARAKGAGPCANLFARCKKLEAYIQGLEDALEIIIEEMGCPHCDKPL